TASLTPCASLFMHISTIRIDGKPKKIVEEIVIYLTEVEYCQLSEIPLICVRVASSRYSESRAFLSFTPIILYSYISGDAIESYVMDLSTMYFTDHGPFEPQRMVTDKTTIPLLKSNIEHFVATISVRQLHHVSS
ncbi:hypothetical protein BC938DRAFT_470926, partial [Jimgerdemannia flammicorona]